LGRAETRGERHAVIVRPDWSVATPHDMAAERIAAAFGGYTSCLDLVDKTIPAFRAALPLLSRRARAAIRRDKRGDWRLAVEQQTDGCCKGRAFRSPGAAARHLRDPGHIAHATGCPRWQLVALMKAAESAWGQWEGVAPAAASEEDEAGDEATLDELWDAGIHPDEVTALAAEVAAQLPDQALPASYFLNVVYGSADPSWIAEVLRYRPDANTAAWLSQLSGPAELASTAEWGAWLAFGVPRSDVLAAIEAGIPSEKVATTVGISGWRPGTAAAILIRWAKTGCSPTTEHLQLLARHWIDWAPSNAAIDALEQEAQTAAAFSPVRLQSPDRTELGVMLALLGTRRAVLRSLASGHVTAAALDLPLSR